MSIVHTLIAAALVAAPLTQAAKPDKIAASAETFMKHAAQGGTAEVALARLAKDKASNPEVKAYAERLERDHSKAGDELKSLASSKRVTLPEAPKTYASNLKERLSKLSGAEFDRAYVSAMVDDHQKDVRAFEREAASGADADVKAFASKTLPTLKEHLQQAQQLAKTVGRASS